MTTQTASTRFPFSRFNSIWLTESLRLMERDSEVALSRPQTLEHLEDNPTDAAKERWLIRRAYLCADANGELEAMEQWISHAKLAFLLLAVLATISGVSATLGLFGAQERHVNVLWTLVGLIGVHFVALLFWCLSALLKNPLSSGVFGRLWHWLSLRWHNTGEHSNTALGNALRRALTPLLSRTGAGLWRLRAASHSLWLIVLGASLVTLLLVLSIRNYGFVLETTIVAPETFVSIVQSIAVLPAALGFMVPDEHMIIAALNGANLQQDEASRRAWASLLCGLVLVYAFLPRFGFWLYARLRLVQIASQLRLDLSERVYAELILTELGRGKSAIRDAAPSLRGMPQVAPQFKVAGKGAIIYAFELPSDHTFTAQARDASPPASIEKVETGGERERAIVSLSNQPAARVLIACDDRLSPDRGSLRWIVAISSHAQELRVLMLAEQGNDARSRGEVWRESLLAIGLDLDRVFTDEKSAMAWVGAHE